MFLEQLEGRSAHEFYWNVPINDMQIPPPPPFPLSEKAIFTWKLRNVLKRMKI